MKSFAIIFFLILLLPVVGLSQHLSLNGNFQVDEVKGCAPLTIHYKNLKAGACGASPCNVKFEVTNTTPNCATAYTSSAAAVVQNPSPIPFPYTFTQPGTYRIITLYEGDCDEITITVTESLQPSFDIYTCSGNQAQVVITDTNYDSYFIDFGDGSPEVQVPKGSLAKGQHTYASSGNKMISVRGKDNNAADNCSVNTKVFNAVSNLTAPILDKLQVIDNGTDIDLNFTGNPNTLYRLEISLNSSGSFQLLKTVHDVSSITLTNLRTDDNYYCFRLGAYDPCLGGSVYSNMLCSMNFDAVAENNQNKLTWQTTAPGVIYNITRDNQAHAGTPSKTFIDAPVVCNQTYVYQVTANYAVGTSISSHKSVTAFSSDIPSAIDDVTSVVGTGSVELTWQTNPLFTPLEYSIYKRNNGGPIFFKEKKSTAGYIDPSYSTEEKSCYIINYVDACNNFSDPGAEVCPIRLDATLMSNNDISLSWSEYSGWSNGVLNYVLEKYDNQGALVETINLGTLTSYLDTSVDPSRQTYVYIVKANAVDGSLGQSISNKAEITRKPILKFPTAFTPDGIGDTRNEAFKLACCALYISEYDLKIFNRWGELIYSTTNFEEGWDGTFKGRDQPEGTYAFVVNIRDLSNKLYTRSGSVVLLRKK